MIAERGVMARSGRALVGLMAEGAGVLLPLPLWIWWAAWKGGFYPAVFLPGLVYLAFAFAVLALPLPAPRLTGPRAVALAALAGLAGWTALSLLWADDRGGAWTGGARALTMLASFALPVVWPPSRRALVVALSLLPVAVAIGLVSALARGIDDPSRLEDGRLLDPTGYPNATAALLLTSALVAIALAARRELPRALRVAGLALGGVLGAAVVLTQSRGIVAVAVVAVVALVALSPQRLRLTLPLLIAAIGAAAVLPWMLAVRTGFLEGDAGSALRGAVVALVVLGLLLAAVGLVYTDVDRRWQPSAALVDRVTRWVKIGAAVAVAAGAVAFFATQGNPVTWVQDRWSDFTTENYVALEARDNRFGGGLGSNRSDYWRVAADLAVDHPLLGVGADNFQAPYLVRRHSDVAPVFAHEVWLGTAAELGLPGLLALIAFCVALAWAVAAAWRRSDPRERAVRAAAVTPLVVLLVHGSVDWVTTFPALFAPALTLAAAASGPLRREAGSRASRGRAVAAFAVAVVIALAATPLLVASRLTDRSASTWQARPAAALDDLDRADRLDPFSATPKLTEGVIELQLGQANRAKAAFEAAAGRAPDMWFPRFELGLIAAQQGRRADALRELAAAAARNPRNHSIKLIRPRVETGDTLDVPAITREVVQEQG